MKFVESTLLRVHLLGDGSCHQGVNTNPSTPPYGQGLMLKDQSLNKGYKAHTSIYRPETGLSSGGSGTRTHDRVSVAAEVY